MTYRFLGGLVLLIWSIAGWAGASTITFDFQFTTQNGNLPGTVSGSIYGLSYNGLGQSATSVIIESYPVLPQGAYSDLEDGNDVALWTYINSNTFDVVDGVITAYRFIAWTASNNIEGANYNLFGLVDSGGLSSGVGSGFNWLLFRQTSEPYNYLAASNERFSIFSQQVAAVPLPAGIVLILTSLATLFGLGSRKRRLGTIAKVAC